MTPETQAQGADLGFESVFTKAQGQGSSNPGQACEESCEACFDPGPSCEACFDPSDRLSHPKEPVAIK